MADLTETFAGGSIGAGTVKHGTGLHSGLYTFTKAAQNDTVTLGDFSTVSFVAPQFTSTGTADTYTISSTTTNEVTLTGSTTGAMRALVYGVKA